MATIVLVHSGEVYNTYTALQPANPDSRHIQQPLACVCRLEISLSPSEQKLLYLSHMKVNIERPNLHFYATTNSANNISVRQVAI